MEMNFKKLFQNFFADKEISNEELKDFSQDGIARIAANNGGGLFTTLLNDTNNAHTAFFGAITDKDVKFAVQQSLTMSKDNIVNTFKKTVQEKSGTIQGAFSGGKNAPEYQEFFPLGLTEYTNATMGNIEVLINRMVTAATAHSAQLGGAPFVGIWTSIQTNFNTARNLQLNKKGEVVVAGEAIDTNRLPLELQWCKNLHFIGFTYPGDVEQCATFFNQSLLKNRKNQNPAEGTLDSNEDDAIFSGTILKTDSTFKATATGTTPGSGFWLYTADHENDTFQGSGLFIQTGPEVDNINWAQIGGKKNFVKIYNPNAGQVEFTVRVVNA